MGAEVRKGLLLRLKLLMTWTLSSTPLAPFAQLEALRACLWPTSALTESEPSHIPSGPTQPFQINANCWCFSVSARFLT